MRDWSKGFCLLPYALYAVEICAVRPIGEFPVMDDWFYASSVFSLDRGALSISSWNEALAVIPIVAGFLWAKIFGFTYSSLHALNILLGAAGLVLMHLIYREVKAEQLLTCLCLCVVACNPFYLHLSCSFMTDIPFATLMLGTILFGLRFARSGERSDYVGFLVCCAFTVLTRQFGLALPMAFLLAEIGKNPRPKMRLNLWAPTIISLVAIVGAYVVLANLGQTPFGYSPHDRFIAILHRIHYGIWLQNILLYVLDACFFISPLIIFISDSCSLRSSAVAVCLFFASYACGVHTLQTDACCFGPLGMGPIWIWDTDPLPTPSQLATIPEFVYPLATLISTFAYTQLLRQAKARADELFSEKFFPLRVTLYAVSIYLVGACLVTDGNDRYMIVVFLLLVLSMPTLNLFRKATTIRAALAFGLCGCTCIFSVFAVHDYYSFNKIRWHLIENLQKLSVKDEDIDGGYEFNDIVNYSNPHREIFVAPRQHQKYVISFHRDPAYQTLESGYFDDWLFGSKRGLYTLKTCD